jgi:hypothetical protein
MGRFLSLVLLVVACDPTSDTRRPRGDSGVDADASGASVDALPMDVPPTSDASDDAGTDAAADVPAVVDAGIDAASDVGADASDAGPDSGSPDAGFDAGCGGEVCSFFPACGCGAEACAVQESGARACVMSGAGTTGSPCTTFDSCAAGLYCAALPTGERQCTPFCEADTDCAGAGAVCIRDTTDGIVQACSFDCDLRSQTGCPAMAYCTPLNNPAGGIVTDCRGPAGSGGRGSNCSSTADCRRGFTCGRESAGASLTCLQWCRAGRDTDCDRSSDDCVTGSPEIRVGSQEYGICVS